ncbi:N-acetylmuramoyl-L-alanine amidase [Oscillatoria sp. FACHB-1407]|uniref:N-acetylmuramoyl-L-alanine amidase family protein n=1 Tax=Oscillatoria sp. FACHB-1407 TaxID=2692847 RepID=UPI0016884807|nr:N-acetylmuramoyl-L-alanine amidase [Oscillatoria sp. FACHB-1407]MBD2462195.1 N-acetylmuramoyl-L-alanine amidase [Oscillatoria sp. FACHB-1407]
MGAIAALVTVLSGAIALADQPLFVAYPPDGHETTAAKIFLIGTAPPDGEVTVNGQPIRRSPAGHFAPSFPLEMGDNLFTLRHSDQELTIRVNRQSTAPVTPTGTAFAEGSLTPVVDIARLPGEPICFEAIAPANATVTVTVGTQTIPVLPQSNATDLPPNSAVLTDQSQPIATNTAQPYRGCAPFNQVGDLGQPQFQLVSGGQTIQQMAPGRVTILSPTNPTVIEVISAGTARTGPSTDYSRLTPLPIGTRAAVTGREGNWFRLDYGAWIRGTDVQVVPNAALPQTLIRGVTSRQVEGATEIVFPLQVPVPVTVQQGDRTFTLTLHNITAQTDTIFLNDDPLIERLDWQQPAPGKAQYTFNLKSNQQWGYSLRYEGTSLILKLRHPPVLSGRSLTGATILLDPGHGGPEDLGARGPTGYPEKDVALAVSLLLRDELIERGATVAITRTTDVDLPLQDRVSAIEQLEPTIALSVHYNALPDSGDAENTAGIGTFWYNTQAHSLAVFLHNYLVEKGDRPSYGVFWNNLALTRPTIAPCVLLELGFMINPNEFEWIVDPTAQRRLADTLADGIEEWLKG